MRAGGANRFNLPQWLLLAMAGSGLWASELLPQVQGVAYLHSNRSLSDGGDFFLFPEGPGSAPTVLPADANTGVVVDGIRVLHGVRRFAPEMGKTVPEIGTRPASLVYLVKKGYKGIFGTPYNRPEQQLSQSTRLIWS